MIDVTYHAALKPNASSIRGLSYAKFEYYHGITPQIIGDLLKLEEIGVILVNGSFAHEYDLLKDGDSVEFHPFVGGGC